MGVLVAHTGKGSVPHLGLMVRTSVPREGPLVSGFRHLTPALLPPRLLQAPQLLPMSQVAQ